MPDRHEGTEPAAATPAAPSAPPSRGRSLADWLAERRQHYLSQGHSPDEAMSMAVAEYLPAPPPTALEGPPPS